MQTEFLVVLVERGGGVEAGQVWVAVGAGMGMTGIDSSTWTPGAVGTVVGVLSGTSRL